MHTTTSPSRASRRAALAPRGVLAAAAIVALLPASGSAKASAPAPAAAESEEQDLEAPTAERPAGKEPAGAWRQLFNGKDLTGWTPKIQGLELGDDPGRTFRVEGGVLKVSYDAYDAFEGRFGHLFFAEELSSYRLRVEYRFTGEQIRGGPSWALRNSGIMIHGQRPETMRRDQDFPVSIEVQLLGGGERGERTTANVCTPGTHVVMGGKLITQHCTGSRSRTHRGDDWVAVEVEVRGGSVRHIVEGETVLEYTGAQLDPGDADGRRLLQSGSERMLRRGTISLQSESHPVEFRKVELLELDDPPEVGEGAREGAAAGGGWEDLLEGGSLAPRWETSGSWRLDAAGVAALEPRPGESGRMRFDAYLWLKERQGDFEIELEYRLAKGGNSGLLVRVGDVRSPLETGIEVQLRDSHGGAPGLPLTDLDTGGVMPGIPPIRRASRPPGEWDLLQLRCRGRDLLVRINGEVVNEARLDHPALANRPSSGAIGIQDHGLPIALRRIRLRRL